MFLKCYNVKDNIVDTFYHLPFVYYFTVCILFKVLTFAYCFDTCTLSRIRKYCCFYCVSFIGLTIFLPFYYGDT